MQGSSRLKTLLKASVTLAVLAISNIEISAAQAAPEEIQVYDDETVKPGRFGLDLHNIYVASGARTADYPGGQVANHDFRFTPEFYYGLAPGLEAGFYVLSQLDARGIYTVGGEKVRLKYVPPRPEGQPWYVGLNFEIGRVSHRYDPNPWNAEVKGIAGWKSGKWDFALNANIDWTVSGPHPAPVSLELTGKAGYEVTKGLSLGVETYNTLGDHRNFGRFDQNEQRLFAVADVDVHGWNLNLGLGRGWTKVTDGWVAKAVVGVPLS